MKIILDTRKTAQENAQHYFEEAKRLKQKLTGAEKGIRDVQLKLEKVEKETEKHSQKSKTPQKLRVKEWFEKFRWCFTRNGLLVVGGRDAHSNETLVKKHLEENDWYFHADTHGAPHCILKEGKVKAKKEDLEDAASFAGLFSSVWKKGSLSVRVYRVSKDQVSKKAPAGESLGKGAFMIYGTREWYDPSMRMAWSVQETKNGFRVMCGPLACVREQGMHAIEIIPGDKSKSEIAKSYQKFLEKRNPPIMIPLDELVSILPPGEFSLKPAS